VIAHTKASPLGFRTAPGPHGVWRKYYHGTAAGVNADAVTALTSPCDGLLRLLADVLVLVACGQQHLATWQRWTDWTRETATDTAKFVAYELRKFLFRKIRRRDEPIYIRLTRRVAITR